jgi:hypothetical protein
MQSQNTFPASGSVGIGTTRPDASAIFQVRSTTMGVILPRHTKAQRLAIMNPATGLLVYQYDSVKGFYVYDGGWKPIKTDVTNLANRSLSNLTETTNINTDLLPDGDNTRNLGAYEGHRWANLYLGGDLLVGNNLEVGHDVAIGRNLTIYGDLFGEGEERIFALRGFECTYIGRNAGISGLESEEEGAANNTTVGENTLERNKSGTGNTAVGSSVLQYNQGSSNSAFGAYSIASMIGGNYNTALGYFTLSSYYGGTGSFNTAVGSEALENNNSNGNSAVGCNAMLYNETGSYNTAVGMNALAGSYGGSGSYNTGVGSDALKANTSGRFNTAIGEGSLAANTTSSENTAAGHRALASNTTGQHNTAVGSKALFSNLTNSRNTAVGEAAGYYSSSEGTFVGDHAYALSGFYNVTTLGYNTRRTASNQVRIGNTAVRSIGGYTSWSTLSDGRFKTNIQANVPGLVFINKLKPVTFTLDVNKIEKAINSDLPSSEPNDKESTQAEVTTADKKEHVTVLSTGFIAQEVEAAAKTLNYDFDGVDKPKNSKDFYGLRYAAFVVPLVKAVQELDAENKELKARIEKLEELIKGTNNTITGSGAYLEQNTPNPVSGSTLIRYHLPLNVGSAKLTITNVKGQLIKVVSLSAAASGQLNLNTTMLAAGTYNYTLWIDDKVVDTKRFVLVK